MSRRGARRNQGRVEPGAFIARFERISRRMGRRSHGIAPYPRLLKLLFGDLSRAERVSFLPHLFRSPISWNEAAPHVWETDRERADNRFPFLQGDVLQSIHPIGVPGRGRWRDAESRDDQDDVWMVLSPDCDCVRLDLVALAPVYLVRHDHQVRGRLGVFRETVAFARFYRFPVPPLPGDDPAVLGYVADFREPFFLDTKTIDPTLHKRLATMTPAAWHVLNAMLFHDLTRADRGEGERVRAVE